MESLLIEATKKTPEVKFYADGNLLLKGRSIPEDPAKFYDVLYNWVVSYAAHPQKLTNVNVELEYFNSGTSKSLLHILRALVNIKSPDNDVKVKWYYESGDDDIYERGDYYSTLLENEFEFIEVKGE